MVRVLMLDGTFLTMTEQELLELDDYVYVERLL